MRIRNAAAVLGIHLSTGPEHRLRIGTLVRDNTGVITFIVAPSYIALGPARPVVSSAWVWPTEELTIERLRSPDDKTMQGSLLPPFFQNLLPEGALRELVQRQFDGADFDNFDILMKLGGDLPGAILAEVEAGPPPVPLGANAGIAATDPRPARIAFSLAGVQLKFSMTLKSGRLTSPATDASGEIILKTPSERHAFVPEAEYTGLRLAAVAGVEVADAWLVAPDAIEGIPARYLTGPARSLAVRRFDRGPNGARIHMEDFGQILGAVVENDKYDLGHDETVLGIVWRFATDGRGQVLEAVRRMVVNILLGNADAHLKNWSLMHRGTETSLTPTYDVVPTCLFGDDRMALRFGNRRNPCIMGLNKFRNAATSMHFDPGLIEREVRVTVGRALDLWPDALRDMPIPPSMKLALLDRLPRLRLVQEVRPGFGHDTSFDEDDAPPRP